VSEGAQEVVNLEVKEAKKLISYREEFRETQVIPREGGSSQ